MSIATSDTRFWEIFDSENKSNGIFMYGDMIRLYSCCGNGVLSQAFENIKLSGCRSVVVGDLFPLTDDSEIEVIQRMKLKYRKKEKKHENKLANKKGFKLNSIITFGKHNGYSIKELIDKKSSYWQWLLENNVLLLHPETIEYCNKK